MNRAERRTKRILARARDAQRIADLTSALERARSDARAYRAALSQENIRTNVASHDRSTVRGPVDTRPRYAASNERGTSQGAGNVNALSPLALERAFQNAVPMD
jgi:hypothetical protein